MAEGYLASGLAERRAVFDLFFRSAPFGGRYVVASGIETAIEFLGGFRFTDSDIGYLRSLGLFTPGLLERLQDLRFTGDVDCVHEGTVVFEREPFLRVTAPILEAQLVETPLLNSVGFASLVATKASRIALVSRGARLLEFGCRRAQGPDGALTATRSAILGGFHATSNLEAGKQLGVPVRGTMAHSWVMAFPDEVSAFRAYARSFPEGSIFLVDTYDTLEQGLPAAIQVAGEMRETGHELVGIRLDSGNFVELSRACRQRLDDAGLPEVKIVVSGDLDEERIDALFRAGACADVLGVGSHLVSASGDPHLGVAYKLAALESRVTRTPPVWDPRLKRSDDPEKATLPGLKDVWRLGDENGIFRKDLVTLRTLEPAGTNDPPVAARTGERWTTLLEPALRNGARARSATDLAASCKRARQQLAALAPRVTRLTDPAAYPVEVSPELRELRDRLLRAR